VPSYDKIGTCRNLCAHAAAGQVIVQMDDDDWQHPYRVEKQVKALREPSREVVGSSWLYWLHGPTETANRLSYWGSLHCLPGASLAYWRSSWFRHPFVPGMAEDGPFTSYFGSQGTCFDMHDPNCSSTCATRTTRPSNAIGGRDENRRPTPFGRESCGTEHPGPQLFEGNAARHCDRARAKVSTVYVPPMGAIDFGGSVARHLWLK
jgi:hypothetical protein